MLADLLALPTLRGERHGWAFSIHVLPHGCLCVCGPVPGRSHEWTAPCASSSGPPSISLSEEGWAFWIGVAVLRTRRQGLRGVDYELVPATASSDLLVSNRRV